MRINEDFIDDVENDDLIFPDTEIESSCEEYDAILLLKVISEDIITP
jgi:hypothetical protein